MRTLYDIIETTKDGETPTFDECFYAMLALDGLLNMAGSDIRHLTDEKTSAVFRKMWADEHLHRNRMAYNADPKTYMGNDVPTNADYQYRRAIGKRLVDAAIAGTLRLGRGRGG